MELLIFRNTIADTRRTCVGQRAGNVCGCIANLSEAQSSTAGVGNRDVTSVDSSERYRLVVVTKGEGRGRSRAVVDKDATVTGAVRQPLIVSEKPFKSRVAVFVATGFMTISPPVARTSECFRPLS